MQTSPITTQAFLREMEGILEKEALDVTLPMIMAGVGAGAGGLAGYKTTHEPNKKLRNAIIAALLGGGAGYGLGRAVEPGPTAPAPAPLAQLERQLQTAREAPAQAEAAYAPAPAPEYAPAPASAGIDMEQLKQLGELHTAGVLSDEEFAAAKAKLLGV